MADRCDDVTAAAAADDRPGPVNVSLSKGDIMAEDVDAIVVSVAANSPRIKGQLAWSVLNAAGGALSDAVEAQLRRQRLVPNEVEHFSVGEQGDDVGAAAGAPQLRCRFLLVVGLLEGGRGEPPFGLRDGVYHALVRAHELRCTSVALPALGSGGFGYAAREVADAIVGAVDTFLCTYGDGGSGGSHGNCGSRWSTPVRRIRLCAVASETQVQFRRALKEAGLSAKKKK